MAKIIGLSLHRCVKDILEGRVKEEDVEKIVAQTMIKDESAWKLVMGIYGRTGWDTDPERAAAIARRFWDAGKIEQPRLNGGPTLVDVSDGHWLVDGKKVRFNQGGDRG